MVTHEQKLPNHVAIIMDGNGRWAKQRNLPRILGHKAGGEAAREIIRACGERGIKVLTMFAFSSENWSRPKKEVNELMDLFYQTLKKHTKELVENKIKFNIIGDYTPFPQKLIKRINHAKEITADNNGIHLNLAVNYSGRWDIFQAAQKVADDVVNGKVAAQDLTQDVFNSYTALADEPDPDLFIRTSGEQRISNFLLWQLAYTELYFTDVLWPDFNPECLDKALQAYAQRERRFGGI